MLTIENLEKYTEQSQTDLGNVVREYCQHLFLSYLYKQPESERVLFKGGTALRIIFHSPRYSEDLDFTGVNIRQPAVEEIFTNTLADVEKTGMQVELEEAKNTTGGYLGKAYFFAYGEKIPVVIQVSLRSGKGLQGIIALIENDYIPAYTISHLPKEEIIKGKLEALFSRKKPRDFYDYFFLLSGNYPLVKDKKNLKTALKIIKETKIDFRGELKKFLPHSHAMHLKNFKKILEQKIADFL